MATIDRGLLALLCAVSVGCATAPELGNDFTEDAPDAIFDPSGVVADAGAAPPFDAAVTPLVVAPIPGSAVAGLSANTPGIDAGAVRPLLPDAGSITLPDAAASTPRVPDAGTSSATDAGTRSTSSSGTQSTSSSGTQSSAPSCNPATCTNECALLSRCCNEANECACQDLFSGLCILPSLPGFPHP